MKGAWHYRTTAKPRSWITSKGLPAPMTDYHPKELFFLAPNIAIQELDKTPTIASFHATKTAFIMVFVMWTCAGPGQSPRFIIDDDSYLDQIVRAGQKLLQEHKLFSLDALRAQVHTKGYSFKLLPPVHEKLEPSELCDRLRESTLAIGTFYKCPDCGGWHFSSSSGFVVDDGGIVSTCCHVVTEEDLSFAFNQRSKIKNQKFPNGTPGAS
jgi:hypothetical protein